MNNLVSMNNYQIAYIVFQLVTIAVDFAAIFVLGQQGSGYAKGQQKQLIQVLYGCGISNLGILVEMLANGNYAMTHAGRTIMILGVVIFYLCIVDFTATICRINIPKVYLWMLFMLDGAIVVCHVLDGIVGRVFYLRNWFVYKSGVLVLDQIYGMAGFLFWLVCVILPGIMSIGMIVVTHQRNSSAQARKQLRQILYIYIALILYAVLLLANILPHIYNNTMTVVAWVFCILAFTSWRNQGIDMVGLAAKAAIDAIDGAVISLNQYNEVIYYNGAAVTMIPNIKDYLGVTLENLPNFELPELAPGERAEMLYDGRRYYVQVSSIYGTDNTVQGYALMFNDMTDMMEMMERIRIEKQRADEANMAKSQFLASVSHEFRTPMNAIVGFSELIIEESRGRKVYDMAVTIKKASMSLLDLVNNILDYSKLEAGKMEIVKDDFSLKEVTEDVITLLKIPAAKRGLALKYDFDESLPSVINGDAGKLRQMLINIINNGLKFTNEGYVRLDVAGSVTDEGQIAVTIMIVDTGIGIKEEDLGRIFGDFEQVDLVKNKSVEGSGLGLSITKQMVELQGGMIDVSSIYGQGTTFTIRITYDIVDATPVSEAAVKAEETPKETRMFTADGMKLLIVDDNKVNIMVAKAMAEPYGFEIDSVQSGIEALELIKEKYYDIIFMDHMMPQMDGVETTGHIREYFDPQNLHPTIVALTANAYGGAKEMFLSKGFDEFITKPVEKLAVYNLMLKIVPDDKKVFNDSAEITPADYTEDELAELWMEGVDVRAGVEARGGGVDAYLELLELYYMEGLEKIEQLTPLVETKDWHNYEIIVHGLKSTSANIGANFLSADAKEHEFAAKEGRYDFIVENHDDLETKYRLILNEIGRVLDKKKSEAKASEEKKLPGLTNASLAQAVMDIIFLSESFMSKEAAEMVDKLLCYDVEPQYEEILNTVKMKYKMYDDDGAEDALHQLSDMLEKLG